MSFVELLLFVQFFKELVIIFKVNGHRPGSNGNHSQGKSIAETATPFVLHESGQNTKGLRFVLSLSIENL